MDSQAHQKEMSDKMKDLTAQAGEMIITHNGKHPHHILEIMEKFEELCKGLDLPFTPETMDAMFVGAKMHSQFEEEEDDGQSATLLISSFLIVRKHLMTSVKIPVKSDKKETKIPVKAVNPTKSTIQPKDLK